MAPFSPVPPFPIPPRPEVVAETPETDGIVSPERQFTSRLSQRSWLQLCRILAGIRADICKQVMDVFANAILPRAQCLVGYFLRDREEALIIAYGMAPYHSNDLPGGGHRRISCSSPRLVRPSDVSCSAAIASGRRV